MAKKILNLTKQENLISHNIKAFLIYANELSSDNIEEIIEKFHNLEFTDVFFVTKNMDGKVFYLSNWAEVIEDKLSLLCKIAYKHNMGVFSWYCTFTEGYEGRLFGSGTSRFLRENPDCAAVNRDGKNTFEKPVYCDYGFENYVCPANPKVQEYQLKLIKEIIQTNPVRGIHLDFIRYPIPGDYCYCEFCRQKFEKEFGVSIKSEEAKHYILKWKQNIITNFVNTTRDEIKYLNNNTIISTLVWKYDDCIEKTQDWKEWNVDFVTPMFFQKGYGKKIKWIKEQININKKISNKTLVAAIGGNYSSLFTKREWDLIEKTVRLTRIKGLLYVHYGFSDVLATLEDSRRNKIEIKKIVLWNIIKIRPILARIMPNVIKAWLRYWRNHLLWIKRKYQKQS